MLFYALKGLVSYIKSSKENWIKASFHENSAYPLVYYFELTLGGISLLIHNCIT